jgi:indolepyruvate ferredoxin oxidoreductase alpha subunit
MGNEAIARGALEGGVSYCAGYPGNPSSEILGSLFSVHDEYDFQVEWSVNEMVALEAAAAFAFSGLRAIATMKQNGINVCADFLTTVCMNELKGGLLVVVCDDPGPLTSTNEEDSRHFAKIAQVPLLEPSTSQEAKDMTRWLLEFSELMGIPCILRTVSRLSHGRGAVTLGRLPERHGKPFFDVEKPLVGLPFQVTINHGILLNKMKEVQKIFDRSPFNRYEGPRNARFVVIATGLGSLYAREAVDILGLEDEVGILKIGTPWPLPAGLLQRHLKHADQVLVVEEIDPFLEDQVKILYAEHRSQLGVVRFLGKNTGDIYGNHGPGVGEMNTDIVMDAMRRILRTRRRRPVGYPKQRLDAARSLLVPREISFCYGCPHRASFFAIKTALALDGRNGFVVGDIGCYGLAAGATGYNQIKALHCMGSGMGNACGFSKLSAFGFTQPVIAVAGESTFYHACLPALVNAKFNDCHGLFVILDNSVTAMTGFQVNPGSPFTQSGEKKPPILAEDITRGLGIKTTVLDPVEDVQRAAEAIYQGLQEDGVQVIVFRRICSTFRTRHLETDRVVKARVDQNKCLGDACGCNRFCTRILGCPGIQYDWEKGKAYVQEDACDGCGLCVQLCPEQAISLVDLDGEDAGP